MIDGISVASFKTNPQGRLHPFRACHPVCSRYPGRSLAGIFDILCLLSALAGFPWLIFLHLARHLTFFPSFLVLRGDLMTFFPRP